MNIHVKEVLKGTSVLILFSIIILVESCNKSTEKPSRCYINTIDSVSSFTFDSDNKVVSYSSKAGFERYFYDSRGNITIRTIDGDSVLYNYDDQNRLMVFTYNSGNNRVEYQYNSNNQITKVSGFYYDFNIKNFVSDNYRVYSYATADSKNISTAEFFDAGGSLVVTQHFEFDNKPNLFTASPELIPVIGQIGNNNNVTKVTVINASGTFVNTISYIYNSNGYPLKATTHSYNGTTSVHTYGYTCK